jgi:hypothetical protein
MVCFGPLGLPVVCCEKTVDSLNACNKFEDSSPDGTGFRAIP